MAQDEIPTDLPSADKSRRMLSRLLGGPSAEIESRQRVAEFCRGSGRFVRGTLPFLAGYYGNSQRRGFMAKQPKQLDELFHEGLKDIYFAEKKILVALPKMAKAAQLDQAKAAFEKHQSETEKHVERLEQIFGMIDKQPHGKQCPAIVGIVEEGQEIMEDYKGSPALDAGLIGAAQAVEHYEIARYGTLKAWAAELGLDDAVKLLDATLAEESKTDKLLSQLAETSANARAEAA
jgi:ferritin-like metal-binding protein YciE